MTKALALFAPPNFLDDLLLRLFSREALNYVVWPSIQIAIVMTLVAFWAAIAPYFERKISAFMQARLGPMRVGPWGILQPLADIIKLLVKEDFVPDKADRLVFMWAPFIAVVATYVVFAVVPFGPDWAVITDINIGILFVLSVSSVSVLALILGGWASNSKFSLLGGLRSAAQMVSYEVSMGLAIIGALMFSRTLSLSGIVMAQGADSIWFLLYQPLGCFIFLVSAIAENNRAPFDLPEAESELVAGFHTEYSGMRWSIFFMAEYGAMMATAAITTTLFLGGWYFPFLYRLTEANGYHNLYVVISIFVFVAKMTILLYLFFWLRWTLPRFRYDQLMDIGWKWLIPAALTNIVVTATAIFVVQALDGWRGIKTVESMTAGLNLTPTGKMVMIAFGLSGLFVSAGLLSKINWRSRDFNLKAQRRNIRLLNVPQGSPALQRLNQ